MSTYKEPIEYVQEAINSITNQTYRNIEFIIIVDAPDNKELINYLKKREEIDNRIKISINEKNCGLPESLNRAIKLARGEYIARMDADDISEQDRLECELKFLQENNLDLVGCNVRDIDENGKIINPSGTHYPIEDKEIKRHLKMNSAIPHPTWLATRELYIELGMYQLFPAAQDYDFLIRAALAGKKLGNLKDNKLRYRINRNGISSTKKILQKTIQYYLRTNYGKGQISSLEYFYKFLDSEAGKRKQENLEKYYQMSRKLKQLLVDKRYTSFVRMGIMAFVVSAEARWTVLSFLKEKV